MIYFAKNTIISLVVLDELKIIRNIENISLFMGLKKKSRSSEALSGTINIVFIEDSSPSSSYSSI